VLSMNTILCYSREANKVLCCPFSPGCYCCCCCSMLTTANCGADKSFRKQFMFPTLTFRGPLMVAQWLRYCATNRKVAGSIPVGVIGIFH
jgi:hypothetical protein